MKKITLLCIFLVFYNNLYSQFTWQQLNGPQGGLVSQITGNGAGSLFMGSIGGGMYRSSDNGLSWLQKVSGFPGPVFDDGTVTFAIANDGDIFASSFNTGVYRSTNNGESWSNTNMPNSIVSGIVIDQYKRVYAATRGGGGIYVTANNGLTWSQKNNGLPIPIQISTICLTAAGELFIGSGSNLSVHKSTDYAESWLPSTLVNTYPDHIVSYSNYIYSASYGLGVYRTTNAGVNWQQVNIGLTNLKINRLFAASNQVLAASDSGVFRSTNNGDTWSKIGFNDKRITEVNIISGGTIMAAVSGEGVYRTTNNGTVWLNSSIGFNSCAIMSIANGNSSIYAGLAYNGLTKSTDNGNSWSRLYGGFKGSTCELVYSAPNGYLFAQSDSGLFRSTNSGSVWQLVLGGFISFNNIVSNQTGMLFGSGSYPSFSVWRSTNNGANWEIPDPNFSASVSTICIAPNGTLFAGTAGGGVYRSTNNGANWLQSLPYAVVNSLTAVPNGNIFGHLNVSLGQDGIYRSTNNGVNWQYVGFGANDYYALKSNSAGHIFAGGFYGAGIYRSTNNGNNWSEVTTGMYNRMITTITFDNAGFAYAGTYFGGLYKTNISTIGIELISSEIPSHYSLSQNYPNPFNPQTKIKFGIPKSSNVTMLIFDITGRQVDELINSRMNPGTHEVTWDGTKYSSGVYFYKLVAENYVETKKMILIK